MKRGYRKSNRDKDEARLLSISQIKNQTGRINLLRIRDDDPEYPSTMILLFAVSKAVGSCSQWR